VRRRAREREQTGGGKATGDADADAGGEEEEKEEEEDAARLGGWDEGGPLSRRVERRAAFVGGLLTAKVID
jgi:hypothetical protein